MSIRILVADDQADVREALVDTLNWQPDFDVLGAAADTEEACRLAEQGEPDVVVMDVCIPSTGGSEATREILAGRPGVRVLAYSAAQSRSDILGMLRAGACGYVTKEASCDTLVDAVRQAADGKVAFSSIPAAAVADELVTRLGDEERIIASLRSRHPALQEAIRTLDIAFQPIVDLERGQRVGMEALARFPSLPGIDVWTVFEEAEALGLQAELGRAALLAALQSPPTGDDGHLWVNISPSLLVLPDFPELLPADIRHRVVLELTEHLAIPEYDVVLEALRPLREDGVLLAIDDAGSGFASLRHIVQLGPDIVKIDSALTAEIESNQKARAGARAICSLGQDLGAVVVVEGIESAGQVVAARDLGIRYGQGFLLGRPQPRGAWTAAPAVRDRQASRGASLVR